MKTKKLKASQCYESDMRWSLDRWLKTPRGKAAHAHCKDGDKLHGKFLLNYMLLCWRAGYDAKCEEADAMLKESI